MGHAYSSNVADIFARLKRLQRFIFNGNRRTWSENSKRGKKK